MDSSQDDFVLPPINDQKCEELFDKLFDKNNNDNDEHLNVKKPIRTYQKVKPKFVRFLDDVDDNDDDDDDNDDDDFHSEDDPESLDENHEPLFNDNENGKKKKRKTVRKKKLAYPNVSKDAVLEAFQKAIESKELPDFDEIEKFPLEIRTIAEQKEQKKRQRKSIRQPIKKPKVQKKSISKVDQNQENVIANENIHPRRSTRSRKSNILIERNVNKTECIPTNEEKNSKKDLFNLDESCISPISHHKNSRKSEKLIDKNDLTQRKTTAIKSSTPFNSTRSRTLRKRRVASKYRFSPNSKIDLPSSSSS